MTQPPSVLSFLYGLYWKFPFVGKAIYDNRYSQIVAVVGYSTGDRANKPLEPFSTLNKINKSVINITALASATVILTLPL